MYCFLYLGIQQYTDAKAQLSFFAEMVIVSNMNKIKGDWTKTDL